MYILKDYRFLEPLVKEGQADKTAPFITDGLCFVDDKDNPKMAYVFKIIDQEIWCLYAWTNKVNKNFYKFTMKLEKFIMSIGLPVLRKGKNQDFKNHTKLIRIDDGIKIYEYIRKV